MTFGVIFDMDGVLVDSYDAHFESWREVAAEHNFDFTEALFAQSFGRTGQDIFDDFWPNDLTAQQMQAIDARKESAYRQIIERDFPPMEGIAELLTDLASAGALLAVGSSGPAENVRMVLEHIDPHRTFAAWVCGQDVSKGKPDPEVFLLAAERIRMSPDQCVVVEDAPAGVEAAHRAGMTAVGLVSTGRSHAELADADVIVSSLCELSAQRLAELVRTHTAAG